MNPITFVKNEIDHFSKAYTATKQPGTPAEMSVKADLFQVAIIRSITIIAAATLGLYALLTFTTTTAIVFVAIAIGSVMNLDVYLTACKYEEVIGLPKVGDKKNDLPQPPNKPNEIKEASEPAEKTTETEELPKPVEEPKQEIQLQPFATLFLRAGYSRVFQADNRLGERVKELTSETVGLKYLVKVLF